MLASCLIVAVVLALGLPTITTAGLDWSDAPLHVMDGVFVLEFVRQAPFDNAWQWAEQFFLRFPALGILVYYPPGFAVFEAAVFAVFGVSIAAARATVMLFAAGTGLLIYALGRRWFDRPTVLAAALLLLTCPHGVRWMRDVMLEWPATFWIVAAIYSYLHYRDGRSARFVVVAAACVTMAYLTKQTAGFIAPVLMLHAVLAPDRRALWRRPAVLLGALASAGVIGAYAVVSARHAALPGRLLAVDPDFLFYLRHLPEVFGWPLLALAAIGSAAVSRVGHRQATAVLLMTALTWYGFSSVIAAKEPRYIFFAAVPLAFAAAGAWRHISLSFIHRAPMRPALSVVAPAGVLVVVIALQLGRDPLGDAGRLRRYDAAVAELVGRPDADLVLVDGVRDGQFVFDVYDDPAARGRIIPIRASKLLYARAARERYDYRQFVDSFRDIVALLDRYGIRYVVMESALPRTHYTDADPPPRGVLRALLGGDTRFALRASWPLRCGDPIWDDVYLCIYEYKSCPPRSSDTITLSMPSMGRDVTIRLPRVSEGNGSIERAPGAHD